MKPLHRLFSILAILCLGLLPGGSVSAATSQHAFPAFSTGTITGGAAGYTKVLDVSGLSAREYLCYTVTADYVPGTDPHGAYSGTMQMQLFDGASTIFTGPGLATAGALPAGGSTTLEWSGVMFRHYVGGGALSVMFQDPATDASGPYTSSLSNVVVTIYPLTPTKHVFPSFTTAAITGGGPSFTKALDVSSLPASEYLYLTVTADYVPSGAWSSTMSMALTDGASTTHWVASPATQGNLPGAGATSLIWSGVLPRSYVGGNPLTVVFRDSFTDAGGPYTSTLDNVSITLAPAATPRHTFPAFSTGTLTGGGAAVSTAMDISTLPVVDYLCFRVTADFVPLGPNEAWSSTISMKVDDGASTTYKIQSGATFGALPGAGATTLTWTGLLSRPYPGSGTLKLTFLDTFNDGSGPYTSRLDNVQFTLYPVENFPTLVTLGSFTATPLEGGITLAWSTGYEGDTAGFNIWRSGKAEEGYAQVNPALLPARGSGLEGAVYAWTDATAAPGQAWFYKLEDIDTAGLGTFHGPVSAILDATQPIRAFQATPPDIFRGGGALLTWSTLGNPTLTLQGAPVTGDSIWVQPAGTTSYVLADGQGGQKVATVSVRPFRLLDMLGLSRSWGSVRGSAAYDPAFDMDGNGRIDDADVAILLN